MPPLDRALRALRPGLSLLALAAAACAGGGAGDGGTSDSPTGPSTPSTPQTSGASAVAGGWTGTTSQGRSFAMHVDDAGVALIMIGFSVPGAGCPQGLVSFISFEAPRTPLTVTNGAFTYSSTGSSGSLGLNGSLATAGTGNGTLTINDTQCNGLLNATWSATRAAGATVSLTGTWTGSLRSSLVAQSTASLTFAQSGNNITGTYSVSSTGAGGTISGVVLGRTARFTLTQTAPANCPGTFNGHAVVSDTPVTLLFYYAGTDCLGTHTGGTGSAIR